MTRADLEERLRDAKKRAAELASQLASTAAAKKQVEQERDSTVADLEERLRGAEERTAELASQLASAAAAKTLVEQERDSTRAKLEERLRESERKVSVIEALLRETKCKCEARVAGLKEECEKLKVDTVKYAKKVRVLESEKRIDVARLQAHRDALHRKE
uniref:Kinesin K39, putative n=1 Tax=Leishmania guyanensis TaxID=5670 RepID=A0A1E1J9G0_LEIGU|nr:kinesin K39, putative [Leishmania guyanensis]